MKRFPTRVRALIAIAAAAGVLGAVSEHPASIGAGQALQRLLDGSTMIARAASRSGAGALPCSCVIRTGAVYSGQGGISFARQRTLRGAPRR